MADLSITAASVAGVDNEIVLERDYLAGETITAGQAVYLKSSDSRWWKAQCDGTAAEAGGTTKVGIARHGSLAGQPLVVQTQGKITIGATVVAATEYVVSNTAGGIMPHVDLATATWYYTRLGYATTTGIIQIDVRITGVQVPA